MHDNLFKAFQNYLSFARSQFRSSREPSEVTKKHLSLYVRAATKLEEVENGIEFHQLVDEFWKEPSLALDSFLSGKGAWKHAVKHFFRRSGSYIDIIENEPINVESLFEEYLQAFQKSHIQRTYLVPMGLVYFSEESMDFGSFQIRQLARRELSDICQSKINEIFYPYASIPSRQFNLLQNCWFICISESVPSANKNYFPWDEIVQVEAQYTLFPSPVELVLQKLALFNWQMDQRRALPYSAKQKEDGEDRERLWQGFEVPFIIAIHDDFLTSPPPMPDVSKLRTVPDFDPQTGEEIGEVPETAIDFDERETAAFKDFIHRIEGIFTILIPMQREWQFLEIALGFFVKAFFAVGLEQLLWHITTLEALLGEKSESESLRQLIARRISLICGSTKRERKTLRKQFLQLYDFRSDLVHGNIFDKQVYVGHLHSARCLGQRTLLWFLHYLNEIKDHLTDESATGITPTREDILLSIDLDHNQRSRLSWLINTLPSKFPYIRNWLE